MPPDDAETALIGTLLALGPYLPEIVLIGGWVPYLYLHYGDLTPDRTRTSLTIEADVLIPGELSSEDRAPLSEVLVANGFRPTTAEHSAIWAKEHGEGGERIEFLTPHTGPGRRIGGVVPIQSQPGIDAVSLEGLSVLQAFPTPIRIPCAPNDLVVHVPSLGAFVVNKASTFAKRRDNARAAKDLLYLHDLSAAGELFLKEIAAGVGVLVETQDFGRVHTETALNHLRLLAGGGFAAKVDEAGAALEAREPLLRAPRDTLLAHLLDLTEVLESAIS